MIRRPRAPRVRRSTLFLALVVAALAFPLGVLANHQFDDVPTAASYHDDVEALVDNGITSGCDSNSYCPSSPVTRGQMAQFLNRLGDLDGSFSPSVNADTVDDLHATAFHRYSTTAPAFTTQYGAWAVSTSVAGWAGETEISFPVPLASAPNIEIVQFGDTGSSNCSGSAASPTAASGFLCVYVGFNAEEFFGGTAPVGSYDPVDGGGAVSRFGTVVFLHDGADAGSTGEASGTFAVTAPLLLIPLGDSGTEETQDATPGSAR